MVVESSAGQMVRATKGNTLKTRNMVMASSCGQTAASTTENGKMAECMAKASSRLSALRQSQEGAFGKTEN
jgi:hypothetical protein